MGKVTGQCPQTTTFSKRKKSRSGIEPTNAPATTNKKQLGNSVTSLANGHLACSDASFVSEIPTASSDIKTTTTNNHISLKKHLKMFYCQMFMYNKGLYVTPETLHYRDCQLAASLNGVAARAGYSQTGKRNLQSVLCSDRL